MSNKLQKKGFTHDSVDNKTVDWYTPKWIFDTLGEYFDLDPCQPEDKIPWIPCDRHYSIIDNGLMQPWDGFVWLNPPYGKYTSDWLAKMHAHRNGIALVFARTDCGWFHDYVIKPFFCILLLIHTPFYILILTRSFTLKTNDFYTVLIIS